MRGCSAFATLMKVDRPPRIQPRKIIDRITKTFKRMSITDCKTGSSISCKIVCTFVHRYYRYCLCHIFACKGSEDFRNKN